jgi:Protein of unknown function (DUF1524)
MTATWVVVILIIALAAFLFSRGDEETDGRRDGDVVEDNDPGAAATTAPPDSPDPTRDGGMGGADGGGQRARDLLAGLTVKDEAGAGDYEREGFGDGWGEAGNGCDVRDEVLAVESTVEPTRGDDGCAVVRGRWVSLYDGYSTPDPTELEIDHLVPLAEAWASGARAWPEARREAYANDTRHPDALVAVTAATNTAKSDKDPAEWMPSKRESWCRYAAAWITQKHAWQLTIDGPEKTALINVLASC